MPLSPTTAALPPPPGVLPNLVNSKEDLREAWLPATLVCLIIPSILVPLRVYVKGHIMKGFGFTDVICLLAWIFFIALCGLAFSMLDYGVGLHAWDVSVSSYTKFAEIINIQQIVYMPSILFTKISVLLQLLQIFVPHKREYRWYALMTLIGANAVFFTILMFLEIFECVPREKIWRPTLPGKCLNIEKTFVATGVINVCDDFTILVLPLTWVWKLHVPTKRKVGISCVFAAGLFACISSVMRLVESIRSLGAEDITYSLGLVSLWATAEVSSGLVVCCLPVMPRLFARKDPRAKSVQTYATNVTSTFRSRNQYIEMDDLSFARLPATFTDIESQQPQKNPKGPDHSPNQEPEQISEILKTVSIKQTSGAK